MQDILIKFLMWLITTLSNIFITPIVNLLVSIMPDLAVALNSVNTVIVTYLIPYLKFAKVAFVQITGVSETLISLICSYIAFQILLHSFMQIYRLIIKIWTLVKP